jgi:hypothetical protein
VSELPGGGRPNEPNEPNEPQLRDFWVFGFQFLIFKKSIFGAKITFAFLKTFRQKSISKTIIQKSEIFRSNISLIESPH